MAGRFQAAHPNPSRLAPSGYFGSKFVTVIVTGKENGEIDFRGYQISNQVKLIISKDHLYRCSKLKDKTPAAL